MMSLCPVSIWVAPLFLTRHCIVITPQTFKQSVSELTGEDREAMDDLVQKRIMQERLFVTLKDGSKVS